MRRVLNIFLKIFETLDSFFHRAIEAMIAAMLLSMVTIVFLQVVLRDIFSSGITWADVAGRHMVLWIAFLGAMLATRSRQQINIDLISRLVSKRVRNIIRFFLDIAACVVCVFLTKAAIALVADEKMMGTDLFLNIPLWIVQLIIPIGFSMMAIEYAFGVSLDIFRYLFNGSFSRVASERRPL